MAVGFYTSDGSFWTKDKLLEVFAGPQPANLAMAGLIETVFGGMGTETPDEFRCYTDPQGVDRIVFLKNPGIELIADNSGAPVYYSIRLEGAYNNLLELGGNFDQVPYLGLGDGTEDPQLRVMADGGALRVNNEHDVATAHSFTQHWGDGYNHEFMHWSAISEDYGADSFFLVCDVGGDTSFRVDIFGALHGFARPFPPNEPEEGEHIIWQNPDGDLIYTVKHGGVVKNKTLASFA